jgi:hypothetical protein
VKLSNLYNLCSIAAGVMTVYFYFTGGGIENAAIYGGIVAMQLQTLAVVYEIKEEVR